VIGVLCCASCAEGRAQIGLCPFFMGTQCFEPQNSSGANFSHKTLLPCPVGRNFHAKNVGNWTPRQRLGGASGFVSIGAKCLIDKTKWLTKRPGRVKIVWYNRKLRKDRKAMKREDRVEQLLARDRALMARLKTATAAEQADFLRQRKQVKSQMNLYGPAAVDRLLRQDFAEITDLVAAQEEARRARWAKHPELQEKIRKLAVG